MYMTTQCSVNVATNMLIRFGHCLKKIEGEACVAICLFMQRNHLTKWRPLSCTATGVNTYLSIVQNKSSVRHAAIEEDY